MAGVCEEHEFAVTLLQGELMPAERLLWSGTPRQGFLLRPVDALFIPFSLFWMGFVLVWEYLALTAGGPVCFPILGIPFVLIGLHMLLGRFFVDAMGRSKTYYSLTDRRIIIVSGLGKRDVATLDLQTLPRIHLALKKDGRGTLTFDSGPPGLGPWGQVTIGWLFGRDVIPRFERIENARSVYEQILDAQRTLSPGGADNRVSEPRE